MKVTKEHQESNTRMAEMELAIMKLDEHAQATPLERRNVYAKLLSLSLQRANWFANFPPIKEVNRCQQLENE